jgi:hypothetical protein
MLRARLVVSSSPIMTLLTPLGGPTWSGGTTEQAEAEGNHGHLSRFGCLTCESAEEELRRITKGSARLGPAKFVV